MQYKKSVLALAAAAVAFSAQAQSSVTLFGTVDTAFTHAKGDVNKRSQIGGNGNAFSKLGFRGTEDLGGGMFASFWLEAGIQADSGIGVTTNSNNQTTGGATTALAGGQGIMFNRRSTVSLGNASFGELRLGRDLAPHYINVVVYDPYAHLGIGTSQMQVSTLGGPAYPRYSNGIGYILPQGLGGLFGQANYHLGENASNVANKDDGNGISVRLGYGAGPFEVSGAYAKIDYLAGDITTHSLGGKYDFGFARLLVVANRERVSGPLPDGRGFQVSAVIPVAGNEIKAAFSRYSTNAAGSPSASKIAIGYVHNLSKRTAIYFTGAHVTNKGPFAVSLGGTATTPGGNSSGFDFGIRHNF